MTYKILIIVSRGHGLSDTAARALSTQIVEFNDLFEAEQAFTALTETQIKSAIVEVVKMYQVGTV